MYEEESIWEGEGGGAGAEVGVRLTNTSLKRIWGGGERSSLVGAAAEETREKKKGGKSSFQSNYETI